MNHDAALEFLVNKLDKAKYYNTGLRSCCPYHDEATPSFFVYVSKKDDLLWFKCHGCEKSGSVNTLLKKFNRHDLVQDELEYRKSRKKRDEKTPEVFLIDTTRALPRAYFFWANRGISRQTAESFNVKFNFYDQCVVIPLYTKRKFRGTIKRHLIRSIKYEIDCYDLSTVLFGFDHCDPTVPTLCFEGAIDAMSCIERGHQAVALVAKSSWRNKIHLLKEFSNLTYVPDNDKPGIMTAREMLEEGFKIKLLPKEYKDANDFLREDIRGFDRWLSS